MNEMQNKMILNIKFTANGDDSSEVNYAVQVNGLTLQYSPKYKLSTTVKPLLCGLDVNISKGHIYALLGENGCGKTTLIKCIIGRLRPQTGIINILGFNSSEIASND